MVSYKEYKERRLLMLQRMIDSGKYRINAAALAACILRGKP